MNEEIIEDPLAAEIAALMTMSEDTIDTADIPEAPDENWRGAKRAYQRTRKRSITLRLDAAVVDWFKARWPDGGYQTAMNDALKAYVEAPKGE
jgi:uncharacterized protein (DUF4415 family)